MMVVLCNEPAYIAVQLIAVLRRGNLWTLGCKHLT